MKILKYNGFISKIWYNFNAALKESKNKWERNVEFVNWIENDQSSSVRISVIRKEDLIHKFLGAS